MEEEDKRLRRRQYIGYGFAGLAAAIVIGVIIYLLVDHFKKTPKLDIRQPMVITQPPNNGPVEKPMLPKQEVDIQSLQDNVVAQSAPSQSSQASGRPQYSLASAAPREYDLPQDNIVNQTNQTSQPDRPQYSLASAASTQPSQTSRPQYSLASAAPMIESDDEEDDYDFPLTGNENEDGNEDESGFYNYPIMADPVPNEDRLPMNEGTIRSNYDNIESNNSYRFNNPPFDY